MFTITDLKEYTIEKNALDEMFFSLKDELIKLKEAKTIEQATLAVENWNKSRDDFLTLYWISYIGYLEDITNEKFLNTESWMAEYEAKMNFEKREYYREILASSFKKELEKKYGKRLFALAENEVLLAGVDTSKFLKKEKELYIKYLNTVIRTKFDFDGQEMTLGKLNTYLTSPNRNVRKKAYDKRYEVLMSKEDIIDEIEEQLISIRTDKAKEYGFSSYSELGFIEMNRIGYTEEDINIFADATREYIVPLLTKLESSRRERLNLEDIDYYDNEIQFSDGNASLDMNLSEVTKAMSKSLHNISEESAELFDNLNSRGLIDQTSRENKSNGGITTYLPNYQTPLFITNFRGIESSITTMHHEFGHVQQLYYSKNLIFHENRWPTFDICEIHSKTTEFLMYPYLETYFGSSTVKYKINHLTSTLSQIVNCVMSHVFQKVIYDHPNWSREERKEEYKRLRSLYFPYLNYNHPYFQKGISWQCNTNSFENPFYVVDYALDDICAFGFYQRQKESPDKAWKEFIDLCQLGGSKSLKEIILSAKLYSPFKKEHVKSLAKKIEIDIKKLIEESNHTDFSVKTIKRN